MATPKPQAELAQLLADAFGGKAPTVHAAALQAGYRVGWVVTSRAEAGKFFGVHPNTIRNWNTAGCPSRKVGNGPASHEYDIAEMVAWRIKLLQDEVDAAQDSGAVNSEQLERGRRIRADLGELELEERRKTLVRREDWVRAAESGIVAFTAGCGTLRSSLTQAFPDREAEIVRRFDEMLSRVRAALTAPPTGEPADVDAGEAEAEA